jgi:metal-dependent amidase/aminoacylase/carboxypeptidase family protein
MPVKNRFAELLPEITAWRRDLHEHPEILFEVHRTAGIVAESCVTSAVTRWSRGSGAPASSG